MSHNQNETNNLSIPNPVHDPQIYSRIKAYSMPNSLFRTRCNDQGHSYCYGVGIEQNDQIGRNNGWERRNDQVLAENHGPAPQNHRIVLYSQRQGGHDLSMDKGGVE